MRYNWEKLMSIATSSTTILAVRCQLLANQLISINTDSGLFSQRSPSKGIGLAFVCFLAFCTIPLPIGWQMKLVVTVNRTQRQILILWEDSGSSPSLLLMLLQHSLWLKHISKRIALLFIICYNVVPNVQTAFCYRRSKLGSEPDEGKQPSL